MAVRGARDEKEKREDFFLPPQKKQAHFRSRNLTRTQLKHKRALHIENTLQYAQSGTCFHTGNLGRLRFGFLRIGGPKMTSSYPCVCFLRIIFCFLSPRQGCFVGKRIRSRVICKSLSQWRKVQISSVVCIFFSFFLVNNLYFSLELQHSTHSTQTTGGAQKNGARKGSVILCQRRRKG